MAQTMTNPQGTDRGCCSPKPKIQERALMNPGQAANLEATFKVLANRTRLRMLHALLREPDLCVGDLAGAVGMKAQAVSNQLQRLVALGIVASRRNGTQIHYRIIDPCVVSLLDQGLCLAEDLPRRRAPATQLEGVLR